MSKRTPRKSLSRPFDEKERLLKEQPWLGQYYGRFLKDWKAYIELQQTLNEPKKSSDYAAFGASFQEQA